METINGVSFEEYVALSSHIAQGVSENEVMQILGLDKATLDDTLAQWNDKLATLMEEDIQCAIKFGEIFANPKVGRFAENIEGAMTDEDVLRLVPSFQHYLDIFFHAATASRYGINPTQVYEIYSLNVGQWAVVAQYYDKDGLHNLDQNAPDYVERFNEIKYLMDEFQEKWEVCYEKKMTE